MITTNNYDLDTLSAPKQQAVISRRTAQSCLWTSTNSAKPCPGLGQSGARIADAASVVFLLTTAGMVIVFAGLITTDLYSQLMTINSFDLIRLLTVRG